MSKKIVKKSILLIGVCTSLFALLGCSVPSEQTSDLSESYDSLLWHLECESSDVQLPSPGQNDLVLNGAGPHSIIRARMLNTEVTVKGSICPPLELKRDIIFVFDVSGSMSGNDPIVEDSCNRLKAINAVMDRLPADISNFAIVTFESSVRKSSTRFFSSKDELFADIAGGDANNAKTVICENTGGTSFSVGLKRAKELFQGGREIATKEILFVSDGESSSGHNEANDLRTNGVRVGNTTQLVTIATVMIGTRDNTYLRDRIASKDTLGIPIHALANDAGSLADILTRLSNNELAGTTVTYGGQPDQMQVVDLMGQLNDFRFELPKFKMDLSTSQQKYEVQLKYWDTHRNTFTIPGTIVWQD